MYAEIVQQLHFISSKEKENILKGYPDFVSLNPKHILRTNLRPAIVGFSPCHVALCMKALRILCHTRKREWLTICDLRFRDVMQKKSPLFKYIELRAV